MNREETNRSSAHERLLDAGVETLKSFGFINVTRENILKDEVYYYFLNRFINTLRGKSREMDAEIEKFIGDDMQHGSK